MLLDMPLGDFLQFDKLQEVQQYFYQHGNSQRELTEEQFIECFRTVLPDLEINERALKMIFRKIDANSIGRIPWAEFSMFFLQQSMVASVSDSNIDPLYAPVEVSVSVHDDSALRAYHHLQITTFIHIPRYGMFFTGSNDGQIKSWEETLSSLPLGTTDHTNAVLSFMGVERTDVMNKVRTQEAEIFDLQNKSGMSTQQFNSPRSPQEMTRLISIRNTKSPLSSKSVMLKSTNPAKSATPSTSGALSSPASSPLSSPHRSEFPASSSPSSSPVSFKDSSFSPSASSEASQTPTPSSPSYQSSLSHFPSSNGSSLSTSETIARAANDVTFALSMKARSLAYKHYSNARTRSSSADATRMFFPMGNTAVQSSLKAFVNGEDLPDPDEGWGGAFTERNKVKIKSAVSPMARALKQGGKSPNDTQLRSKTPTKTKRGTVPSPLSSLSSTFRSTSSSTTSFDRERSATIAVDSFDEGERSLREGTLNTLMGDEAFDLMESGEEERSERKSRGEEGGDSGALRQEEIDNPEILAELARQNELLDGGRSGRLATGSDMFLLRRKQKNRKWGQTQPHSVQVVEKKKPIPIVCMCYLPYSQLIAVCSADRRVTFYPPGVGEMRPKGQIKSVTALPTSCCGIHPDCTKSKRELLVLGKDDGSLDVIVITPELVNSAFDIRIERGKQELDKFLGVKTEMRLDLQTPKHEAADTSPLLLDLASTTRASTSASSTRRLSSSASTYRSGFGGGAGTGASNTPTRLSRASSIASSPQTHRHTFSDPFHSSASASRSPLSTLSRTESDAQVFGDGSTSSSPKMGPSTTSFPSSPKSPLISATSSSLLSVTPVLGRSNRRFSTHDAQSPLSMYAAAEGSSQSPSPFCATPRNSSPIATPFISPLTSSSSSLAATPLLPEGEYSEEQDDSADELMEQLRKGEAINPVESSGMKIPFASLTSASSSACQTERKMLNQKKKKGHRSVHSNQSLHSSSRSSSNERAIWGGQSSQASLGTENESTTSKSNTKESVDEFDLNSSGKDKPVSAPLWKVSSPHEKMRHMTSTANIPILKAKGIGGSLFGDSSLGIESILTGDNFGVETEGDMKLVEEEQKIGVLDSLKSEAGNAPPGLIESGSKLNLEDPFQSPTFSSADNSYLATTRRVHAETLPDIREVTQMHRKTMHRPSTGGKSIIRGGLISMPSGQSIVNLNDSSQASPLMRIKPHRFKHRQNVNTSPRLGNVKRSPLSRTRNDNSPLSDTLNSSSSMSGYRRAKVPSLKLKFPSANEPIAEEDGSSNSVDYDEEKESHWREKGYSSKALNEEQYELDEQDGDEEFESNEEEYEEEEDVDSSEQNTSADRKQRSQTADSNSGSRNASAASPARTKRQGSETQRGYMTSRDPSLTDEHTYEYPHLSGMNLSVKKTNKVILKTLRSMVNPKLPAVSDASEPVLRAREGLWSCQAHNSNIVQVEYISELQGIVTASLDSTMKLFDIDRLKELTVFRSHTKGVRCFFWSKRHKVLISGSMDHTVAIWNPIAKKLLGRLVGHAAPVISVAMDDGLKDASATTYAANIIPSPPSTPSQKASKEDSPFSESADALSTDAGTGIASDSTQVSPEAAKSGKPVKIAATGRILSLGMDGCIRIWDYQSQRCLQVVASVDPLNLTRFGSLSFNPRNGLVILGSKRLVGWKHVARSEKNSIAHRSDVEMLLYNKAFEQLISIDLNNVINIWTARTGRNEFRFRADHSDSITAACLDNTGRKLVTGSLDGFIKVWNPNRGLLLKMYKSNGQRIHVSAAIASASSRAGLSDNDLNFSDLHASQTNKEKGKEKEKADTGKDSDGKSLPPLSLGSVSSGIGGTMSFGSSSSSSSFEYPEAGAVHHLCYCSSSSTPNIIVAVGSRKTIYAFDDGMTPFNNDRSVHSENGTVHGDNIMCATFQKPNLLVASADDGSLAAWNIETGTCRAQLKMNAIKTAQAAQLARVTSALNRGGSIHGANSSNSGDKSNTANGSSNNQQSSQNSGANAGQSFGSSVRASFAGVGNERGNASVSGNNGEGNGDAGGQGMTQSSTALATSASVLSTPHGDKNAERANSEADTSSASASTASNALSSSPSTQAKMPNSSAPGTPPSSIPSSSFGAISSSPPLASNSSTVSLMASSTSTSTSSIKNLEEMDLQVITQCLFVPLHPDLLMTHGIDGKLRFWSVTRSQLLLAVQTYQSTAFCAFDPSGTWMALGNNDGVVQVYRVSSFTNVIERNYGITSTSKGSTASLFASPNSAHTSLPPATLPTMDTTSPSSYSAVPMPLTPQMAGVVGTYAAPLVPHTSQEGQVQSDQSMVNSFENSFDGGNSNKFDFKDYLASQANSTPCANPVSTFHSQVPIYSPLSSPFQTSHSAGDSNESNNSQNGASPSNRSSLSPMVPPSSISGQGSSSTLRRSARNSSELSATDLLSFHFRASLEEINHLVFVPLDDLPCISSPSFHKSVYSQFAVVIPEEGNSTSDIIQPALSLTSAFSSSSSLLSSPVSSPISSPFHTHPSSQQNQFRIKSPKVSLLFLAIASGTVISLNTLDGSLVGSYGVAVTRNQPKLSSILNSVPFTPLGEPNSLPFTFGVEKQKKERKRVIPAKQRFGMSGTSTSQSSFLSASGQSSSAYPTTVSPRGGGADAVKKSDDTDARQDEHNSGSNAKDADDNASEDEDEFEDAEKPKTTNKVAGSGATSGGKAATLHRLNSLTRRNSKVISSHGHDTLKMKSQNNLKSEKDIQKDALVHSTEHNHDAKAGSERKGFNESKAQSFQSKPSGTVDNRLSVASSSAQSPLSSPSATKTALSTSHVSSNTQKLTGATSGTSPMASHIQQPVRSPQTRSPQFTTPSFISPLQYRQASDLSTPQPAKSEHAIQLLLQRREKLKSLNLTPASNDNDEDTSTSKSQKSPQTLSKASKSYADNASLPNVLNSDEAGTEARDRGDIRDKDEETLKRPETAHSVNSQQHQQSSYSQTSRPKDVEEKRTNSDAAKGGIESLGLREDLSLSEQIAALQNKKLEAASATNVSAQGTLLGKVTHTYTKKALLNRTRQTQKASTLPDPPSWKPTTSPY
ncbi:putative WD domain, G-beta repeat [Monocercomonoides exilis]|uniref:putative WD domain, G-beta repeat n=1 Tax=Monocercomonoides exilis TaxID=2049356 RepID=UPI00355AB612|nr:putative WD domain, G-beta repeat [Monocercomonoides exilis]|eukprot:MONOS_4274.1-p1 / transcript=MONOS_4274.1 / gene=MONOS_4274 / organism=Monocercomonoides_exilis_PA203 / gene_product=WD domain, G-beta repeat / transcript_product=WD domain, G-beta repeat / location=Mono_scaffold00111:98896-108372(+) / protein_length=3064 / sequence_SO=supercontig / SO=protein_coding / is_pseudo=false